MNDNIIIIATVLALSIVSIKLIISANKDPIGHILLFYFIFGFGPVINHILGFPIYFGTVERFIPMACLIMLIGMTSFAIPHLISPIKKLSYTLETDEKHQWPALKIALTVAILYGVFKILIITPMRFYGASKVEMINFAFPQLHYIYLLIQLFLTAFYFTTVSRRELRPFYYSNLVIYIAYCLIISERDFIFPIASIFILNTITSKKKVSFFKYALTGMVLAVFATLIFLIRDTTQSRENIISSILNQGSVLFINTYILELFDNGHPFFYGKTFLHSVINLIPSFIYTTGYNNLAWFKELYAQASDSGYGFALDAEGYINFGLPGVAMVYLSISLYWRMLLKRFHLSEFYRYLTLFSTGFFMYAIRNDSLAVLKGSLYAALFYLFLNTSSYLLSLRK